MLLGSRFSPTRTKFYRLRKHDGGFLNTTEEEWQVALLKPSAPQGRQNQNLTFHLELITARFFSYYAPSTSQQAVWGLLPPPPARWNRGVL